MVPSGQAAWHSVQKRQRPRSRDAVWPFNRSASVGQASEQARQPSGQRVGSTLGAPRKWSGVSGAGPSGNFIVRWPCWNRASSALIIQSSKVVSAIGKAETLVAEREVEDLLVPEGVGQRH